MSSATKTDTATLFRNGQTIIPIRIKLQKINHPQGSTLGNRQYYHQRSCAIICQRKSKSWDMRYHWLKDKTCQNILDIYWDKGNNNYADYFTKKSSQPS